ncbi:SDR family NAD(P)-dependent oxidoreductase [Streptomyces massasporeus]|uniref:type I polyketide synthase n=1 Tax=Streptomyces massasporeus TaxID=67324 RepID=UPI0036FB8621
MSTPAYPPGADDEDIETVAVVGMACRLPGADTPERLWANLREGRSAVSRFGAEEAADVPGRPSVVGHPAFVGAEALLDGVDLFDANLFGYAPREAQIMDPQHRIGLEVAWDTFESAGYDPACTEGPVGVFLAAGFSSYLVRNLLVDQEAQQALGGLSLLVHNDKDFLATGVSHRLGLRGPSIAVGSACSSSLAAVHLAARSLQSYECDLALAGGVSLQVPQRQGYLYAPDGIYSPSGACRPFDAAADGTVGGSGAGMVLLKRLSDAVRDGDHIHAVVLGSALNNDGRDKIGFTAPSVRGQSEVIAEAHAISGVSADTLGYVEAHGTGTELGDPVEIEALTKAFRHTTDRRGYCAVGSVKAAIGHLDAAAGIVGFIASVLVAREGTVPPSPYFQAPNPAIDFATSPFFVATQALPLSGPRGMRRVGVSSFGVGGTNAHVVLQEPPERAPGPETTGGIPLLLSGRDPGTLRDAAGRLARRLTEVPGVPLTDIARSLAGKRAFPYRRAILATDSATAVRALESTPDEPAVARRVVFTLPDPTVLSPTDLAALAAEPAVSRALDALLARAARAGVRVPRPAADCAPHPATSEPATAFAVQYAMVEALADWGVRPTAVSGAGTGELTAAVTAGLLTPVQALRLVTSATPGARAAVLAEGFPSAEPLPCLGARGGGPVTEQDLRQPEFGTPLPCGAAEPIGHPEPEPATLLLDVRLGGPAETPQQHRVTWTPPGSIGQGLAPVLAALWEAGAELKLDSFHRDRGARRAPVPGHAFRRTRYWIGPPAVPVGALAVASEELRDAVGQKRPSTLGDRPAARAALDVLCAELALAHLTDDPYGDLLRTGRTAGELAMRLGTLPAYRPFLQYQLSLLVEEGLVVRDGERYILNTTRAADPEGLAARIRADHPDVAGIAELLLHCGRGYRDGLVRPGAGLAVLRPRGEGDLVTRLLTERTTPYSWADPLASTVARLARRLADGRDRPLRVLEVGAGGGRLTQHLVAALEGTSASCTVTDVSPHFVAALRAQDVRRGHQEVSTGVLDITADPSVQGFPPASYDLVVGLDVVHATPNVPGSLRQLRALLAPGGTLALVETVARDRWIPMVWGLTEGWWSACDGRCDGPLLSVEEWTAALLAAGFTVDGSVPGMAEPTADAALLLARRPGDSTSADGATVDREAPARVTDPERWTYRIGWHSASAPEPGPDLAGHTCLAFVDGDFGDRVCRVLEERGVRVVRVLPDGGAADGTAEPHGLDPADPDAHQRLVDTLTDRGVTVDLVAHLWSVDRPFTGLEAADEARTRGLHSVLDTVRALARTERGAPGRVLIATAGGQDVLGGDLRHPEHSLLTAAAKVLPREYPGLGCTVVDLAPDVSSGDLRRHAERVVAELLAAEAPPVVAHRGRRRWLPQVRPCPLPAPDPSRPLVRPGGGYLVCGGLGGIGLALAEYLLREGGQVLLTRRAPFPHRARWAELPADSPDGRIARRLLAAERSADHRGARALVLSADLTDLTAMQKAVDTARREFGGVHGVVHAAGVTDPAGVVQRRDRDGTDRAIASKTTGTLVLERALAGTTPDFVVLCSSIGTALYKLKYGEVGYVAANEFLNAFAHSRRAQGMPVVAVGWTDWLEGGMWTTARRELDSRYEVDTPGGIHPADDLLLGLTDGEGVEVFRRAAQADEAHVLVSTQDLHALLARHEDYTVEDHRRAVGALQRARDRDIPAGPTAGAAVGPTATGRSGTVTERTVAGWWSHLLGIEDVDPDDDFFTCGGDSLIALRMLALAEEAAGAEVSLPWFFEHPTVAKLTAEINRLRRLAHAPGGEEQVLL